jgi:SAM-dependent methyltransferase
MAFVAPGNANGSGMSKLEQNARFVPPAHELYVSQAHTEFWNSFQAVEEYSSESWCELLFLGEQLAFQDVFRNGYHGHCVLDLGCGAGRTTRFLHEQGAEVIGVDISRALIDAAQFHAPDIQFQVGDASRLDFEDASFDVVVFSFNGLDCIYPKRKRLEALAEINRVLQPGGYFIFSHHNLAAFFFGGWNFLWPLRSIPRFRAEHIINGDAFHRERYFANPDDSRGITYYNAWPQQVIQDLRQHDFRFLAVYPNSTGLWRLQSLLRTGIFTRYIDPWPYYVFTKAS